MEKRTQPVRRAALKVNNISRYGSFAHDGYALKECRYETRQRSGYAPIGKARYSPFPRRTSRKTAAEATKSVEEESNDLTMKRKAQSKSLRKMEKVIKKRRVKESSSDSFEFEEELDEQFPSCHTNDYEYQFKKAIRLYRYMSLPDTQSGYARPIYRPFLKRNFFYMKVSKPVVSRTNEKTVLKTLSCLPSYCAKQQKFDIKKEHLEENAFGTTSEIQSKPANNNNESLLQNSCSSSQLKGEGKHARCDHVNSMIKFIDVRHKHMPDNYVALINVYLSIEEDGVFKDIIRLPSATVQMSINTRKNSVAIDLPFGIGCPLECSGHRRNDYIILRVTFLVEDLKRSGGHTLRTIPSRKAEMDSKDARNRITKVVPKSYSDLDDNVTLFGASCLSSCSRNDRKSGLIYGNESVVLVPSTSLKLTENWRADKTFTARLIELGKKLHMSPFIRLSVMQDNCCESSSSEDDDESKSLSSTSTLLTECSPSFHQKQESIASTISSNTSSHNTAAFSTLKLDSESVDFYVQSKIKRELSLDFPKRICYRFITKGKKEEDKGVSENGNSTSASDNFRTLNGQLSSGSQENSTGSKKASVIPTGSNMNSFSKFRLYIPRRDPPLSALVDKFGSKFDKCSKIVRPKPISSDDQITVPELHYSNFPEPDNDNVVTRFLSPSNKCFFCMGTFPDMFALLFHMRCNYPRLDVVYRGDLRQTAVINTSAPVFIDIFLKENFDGSFEGQMARQYVSKQNRNKGPQRCLPNNRLTYLVCKGEGAVIRGMKRDLSVFFNQADREKRALKGNNAAYFGFRSRHPLMNCSLISTKQTDQEWLREHIVRQIEDFLDLSRPEKDFMIMWNIFLLNLNHKPFGRNHVYRTCRLFIQRHCCDLLRKNLYNAWIFHLTSLYEKEALDADEVYDLSCRLQENYEPNRDIRHVVYNTRSLQEASSSYTKKELPTWQKDPVHGPKVSILRSSSVVRLSAGESAENEDRIRKFLDEPQSESKESSNSSVCDSSQHNINRRQKGPDCSKYLTSPRSTQPPKWLSYADNSEDC